MRTIPRLHRIRRGVRTALALGIGASIAGNVLHADAPGAYSDLIARMISAWPSVALAICVELLSRVPRWSRPLTALSVLASGAVASVAAWVSYWHMAAVAARYGETWSAAHLIPLSVDGLIVVASVCLVEINRLVRATEAAPVRDSGAVVRDNPAPVRDNGDSTPPTPHAATPNGTGEPGGNPTLPPPRTPPGRLAPAFLAPVPDNAAPARDNPTSDPDSEDSEPDATAADGEDYVPPDPDPLLGTARDIAGELPKLSRPILLAELRKRGHRCGTGRAEKLLATLAAERDAAGTSVPDNAAPVPDSLAGRNGTGP